MLLMTYFLPEEESKPLYQYQWCIDLSTTHQDLIDTLEHPD